MPSFSFVAGKACCRHPWPTLKVARVTTYRVLNTEYHIEYGGTRDRFRSFEKMSLQIGKRIAILRFPTFNNKNLHHAHRS